MTNLDWALRYFRAGWLVFPCRNKKPHFQALKPWGSGWGWINKQILTEKIVHKWWQEFPEAQIALICGKESGITVVDIDWLKNPIDGLPDVQGSVMPDELAADLPATLTSTTGGRGKHLFYRFVDIPNSAKTVHPQMDIRSEGGYVILPPSIHASGNQYEWDEDSKWSEEALQTLASFPTQVMASVASVARPANKNWSEVMRGASEGMRNVTAASFCGVLLRGLKPRLAWDIFELWNEKRNSPPLPAEELQTIYLSILRRERTKYAKH